MRRTREVKAETRAAILAHASALFRTRGIEGASVGEVMAEAGLTHGGFYRHFETKEALVAAAISSAFEGFTKELEERAAFVGMAKSVEGYLDFYLSDLHVAHPGQGCPIPALAAEISRGGEAVRAAFSASFNRSLTMLAEGMPGPEADRRAAAARALALRVGAIVIARASDPATAREVLDACRKGDDGPR